MIKQKTFLNVIDNSGAKTAECIKILGGYKKKYANIGDLIIVSIKSLKKNSNVLKIKKKTLFKGIVIQTKNFKHNTTGFVLKLETNAVMLLDKQMNPFGTRITGFICNKFNDKVQKLTTISLKML